MVSDWSRRGALHLAGAAITALSGCLDDSATANDTPNSSVPSTQSTGSGPNSESNKTEDESSSEDSTREPPECDENLKPLPQLYDEVEYGRLDGLELIVEPETVALGDDITFTLQWAEGDHDNPPEVGNDEKFTIERKTSSGWQSIYQIPERGGWNDMGAAPPDTSPPTTWYDWSFTLTIEGMEHSTQYNTPYAVCDSLEPGSYRFLYWGVSPPEEKESNWKTDYAIGAKFSVNE